MDVCLSAHSVVHVTSDLCSWPKQFLLSRHTAWQTNAVPLGQRPWELSGVKGHKLNASEPGRQLSATPSTETHWVAQTAL